MSTESTPLPPSTLGLGDDFAANRAELSAELTGRTISVRYEDGEVQEWTFVDATNVTIDAEDERRQLAYEAFLVRPGTFLVAVSTPTIEQSSIELVIDLTTGRALVLEQHLGPTSPGVPAVQQRHRPAALDSSTNAGFERSEELFGTRALWEYSANDVYEHLYLNAEWYVWHCLAGDEYPLADTDPCRTYKLGDDLFLLTFSEKVMTMGAAMVLDFAALRSYCAAFGIEPQSTIASHFTFGAFGKVLSRTSYPSPLSAR